MSQDIKPFLKWVGGKTQSLEYILDVVPFNIETHHEIFVGGGSVLFSLLNHSDDKNSKKIENISKICAYDINKRLIYTYNNIKWYHKDVFDLLNKMFADYRSCPQLKGERKVDDETSAKNSKESYYYWIRDQYNLETDYTSTRVSAQFIFLNRTCFRGIYRESRTGKFNVPFGNYKTVHEISLIELETISRKITKVDFIHKDFNDIDFDNEIQPGDFVYMDPPYVPECENGFTSYTKNGFNDESQKSLISKIKTLQNNGVRLCLSNSDSKLITDAFKDNDKFKIVPIISKRRVNSKKPDSTIQELLIYNLKNTET